MADWEEEPDDYATNNPYSGGGGGGSYNNDGDGDSGNRYGGSGGGIGGGGGRGRGGGRGGFNDRDNKDREHNGGGYERRGRGRGGGGGRGRGGGGYGGSDNDDGNGDRGREGGRGGFNNRDNKDREDNGGGYERRGRGRGGGGGRGRGGGGYGGGDNDDDNGGGYGSRSNNDRFRGGGNKQYGRNNDADKDDGDDDNGYGGGRKYDNKNNDQGDGGGRGVKRFGGDDDGPDSDNKAKESYIPPEPTDDENIMFGSGISSGINFDKFDNISIGVTGDNQVAAITSFDECGLREIVLENLKKSGYKKPTPVQKHSFPSILNGRDVMACAQTGSGKTAAYLVPIINTLLETPSELVITSDSVEPQAVIVCPTRELAIQIFNEARKFAHGSIIKTALAYGGTVASRQAQNLMRGCHVLVATPGRINDFVERGRVSFASVRFFVLDEADRMLDMGFLSEIVKMLDHTTMTKVGERQTLMFSATFPEEIQTLASKYLNDYLFIAVGIVGGACADVEQVTYEVRKFDKRGKLVEIMKNSENEKSLTLVFVEQKRTADFIAAYLSENDFPTTSIHGDRLQSQREQALSDFKSGRMPTLVATSVAARGLDIKNVSHVINYDLPSSIDEYVHRIGRTGRVGNRGKASSFFDPDTNKAITGDLAKILKQCGQEVPAFLSEQSEGGGGGDGFGFRDGQTFSGRDVRKFGNKGRDDDFGSNSYPTYEQLPQVEEEEGW